MRGDFPATIGSIGVGLLAYFLNLIKRVSKDSRVYTTLPSLGLGWPATRRT